MSYQQFRTGLTYRDVYRMLFDRKFKRRRTVLGKWHQIKLEMWNEFQNRLAQAEVVPF